MAEPVKTRPGQTSGSLPPRRAAANASRKFSAQMSSPSASDSGDSAVSEFGEARTTTSSKATPKNNKRTATAKVTPFRNGRITTQRGYGDARRKNASPKQEPEKTRKRKTPPIEFRSSSPSTITPAIQSRVKQTSNYSSISKRAKYADGSIDYSSIATLSRPSSPLSIRSQPALDDWSLETLGDYVWLRLNLSGNLAGPGDGYWWPGKVDASTFGIDSIPIRLYGDDGHGQRVVAVDAPSESILLSFRSPLTRNARFNMSTFTHITPAVDMTSQGMLTDLQLRFKIALEEMAQADADENDGLPDPSFMFGSQSSRTNVDQENEMMSDPPELSLADQGFDEELTIPGELVLARAKNAPRLYYWPAKVLKWIPPTRSQRRGKYQLLFFDTAISDVDRKWFYTVFEPEFGTCLVNLPKIHSFLNYGIPVGVDEDVVCEQSEDTFRSSSPEPDLQVPPTDFLGLSVSEQFRYTVPILNLIINGKYPPAKDRHDKFVKGGKARETLLQEGSGRGVLSSTRVGEIADELRRWALRDERFALRLSSEGGTSTIDTHMTDIHTDRTDRFPILDVRSISSSVDHIGDAPLIHQSVGAPLDGNVVSHPVTSNDQTTTLASCTSSITEIPGTPINQRKTRPIGGTDYEALSRTERSQYCTDVLLPETIIQYLLWQGKHRTALEPAENEEVLYQLGLELTEQDGPDAWIRTIVITRETRDISAAAREKTKEKPSPEDRGSRTRPTFKR